jgi:hypothetical protein
MKQKNEVNYRIAQPAAEVPCSMCANFRQPNACVLVAGDISPQATCDLVTPASGDGSSMGGVGAEIRGAPAGDNASLSQILFGGGM